MQAQLVACSVGYPSGYVAQHAFPASAASQRVATDCCCVCREDFREEIALAVSTTL